MTKLKTTVIIAIDGPAGSGKSTIARHISKDLGIPYIDTGAMYRAVTLKAMKEGVSLDDSAELIKIAKKASIELMETRAKVILDGKDVTHSIRTPELTKNVFKIAQVPEIRKEMVKKQRVMGKKKGAVMEGRDIGTVVFPKADFKFYLEADPTIRAQRRYKEIMLAGRQITLHEVNEDLKRRDKTDYDRKEGPLKQAKDAVLIDTTALTIREVIDTILTTVQSSKSLAGPKLKRSKRAYAQR